MRSEARVEDEAERMSTFQFPIAERAQDFSRRCLLRVRQSLSMIALEPVFPMGRNDARLRGAAPNVGIPPQ